MLTEQEFKNKALSQIPDNALDRLTPLARKTIVEGNPIFDVHCHIFDKKCIHPLYFTLRALGFSGILVKLLANRKSHAFNMHSEDDVYAALAAMNRGQFAQYDADTEWNELETDIDQIEADDKGATDLVPEEQEERKKRLSRKGLYATVRVLLKKDMKGILKHYLKHHAIRNNSIEELDDRDMVTTVIMMDIEKGWEVPAKKSLRAQIAEIKELAKEFAIVPYLSIDPRRYSDAQQNLFDLFLEAFSGDDASFFGIKLYPSLGYHPADIRLKAIYEVCEKKGIPVLTHGGGAIVSTYKLAVSGTKFTLHGNAPYNLSDSTRKRLATQLNEPELWRDVLECFPSLRLNLGHHGGGSEWATPADVQQSTRIPIIEGLMQQYDNVYADFSFNLKRSMADTYTSIVSQNPLLRRRAMFGTDYWVVLPQGDIVKDQTHLLQQMKAAGMLEEFVSGNIRRYLGV
jgi:predicted TIM-barrel fold metal-dependent hydrolase